MIFDPEQPFSHFTSPLFSGSFADSLKGYPPPAFPSLGMAGLSGLGSIFGSGSPNKAEEAFDKFLSKLKTPRPETEAAASHRASIEAKLIESWGMTAFFRTGSFGNGLNIAGYSDVDYFGVIPATNLNPDSARTLERLADILRERFPTTGVRVNSPGVRVPFGLDGAEATEIVPVHQTGFTRLGFRQFGMPDGSGRWKFSAPESHKAFVDALDAKLGGKLKPLIRFLKAWKVFRNVPIRSFYLEMRAAAYARRESSIVYDIDLKRILQAMWDDQLAEIDDPRFPNQGQILRPCATEPQRLDALNKLQMAYYWGDQAVSDRLATKEESAIKFWDVVFNHEFASSS